jgi:phosphopantothenoylcysteine decarboxylase/phosphopantothenate--cysteine ligase
MLIAPLSANTMAKMATGVADNLLLTTILSARCPIYFAPAMDLDMYRHPTTVNNVKVLQSFGYHLIEPSEGELASGLSGMGRLEEPEEIFEIIREALEGKKKLNGKKAVVTAGPTYEAIDPVRFIGNHSSGKMGVEIARALAEQGAVVDLILGPSCLTTDHPEIKVTRVTSAAEMYEVTAASFPGADIAVLSAAVADFTPEKVSEHKIKKGDTVPEIQLKPTKDILASLGKMKTKGQLLVGFALETDNPVENAKKKLENKNLDFIVLNSLKDEGAGFGHDTNKVTLLFRNGEKKSFDLKSKKKVARDIVNALVEIL